MTDPLFPDTEPCGCPRGSGHRCDPPFVVMVPCISCGNTRPIVARVPSRQRLAEQVQCRSCASRTTRANLTSTHQDELDEVAVQRLIAGQRPSYTTRAERQQAVQYLLSKRLTNAQIARRIGTTTRTVERLRARSAA